MPGYKTHIMGGLLTAGAGLAALSWLKVYDADPLQMASLAAVSVMGAMVPDVDAASKGRFLFYTALLVLDLALFWRGQYKWAAILGLCAILPGIGPHRGWTHTWWAMLLVPAPIVVLPMYFYGQPWQACLPFYVAAVGGYLSHLVFDGKW